MATTQDDLKRRTQGIPKAAAQPQGPVLTPDQQKAQSEAEWRRGSQQRQAEFKQKVGGLAGAAAEKIGSAYGTVLGAATVVPRTIQGVATGEIPINVNHLPDYSSPAKDAERQRNDQSKASEWVAQNPQAAEQAAAGMSAVAGRAVDAGLRRPIGGLMAPASAPAPTTDSTGPDSIGGAPAGGGQPQPAPQDSAPPGQPAAAGGDQWSLTSVGGIAGRIGAGGIPEFTNDAKVLSSAGPQKVIGNVGNGKGGFSQGQPGDAAAALAEQRRALEIREGMVATQAKMDGARYGSGIRGLGGGADAMDMARQRRLADIASANGMNPGNRQKAMQVAADQQLKAADLGLRGAQLQQQSQNASLDRGLRSRELAATEQRNQLEGQRTQQEIEQGSIDLQQKRQQAEMLSKLQDPNTPEDERAILLQAYQALSGKGGAMKPKDYVMSRKVPVFDKDGNYAGDQDELIDLRTGMPVGGGQMAQSARQQYEQGKVYKDTAGQRALYAGVDENGNDIWEEI